MVSTFRKQQRVSGEDEDGFQDEGEKQLDVNVVASAVQFPEETFKDNNNHIHTHTKKKKYNQRNAFLT